MRKQISVRLNEEAIARLDLLANKTGMSSGRVVERLLTGKLSWWDEKGADAVEAVKEKFETVPPSAQKRVEKKVQDISSTKQRRVNPMTGKPFGAVPK